jgi:hypothetical protein
MEGYKLTKEEKEKIRDIEFFRKKAKTQVLSYLFGENLLAHMAVEESKTTDKSKKDPIEKMICQMQGFDPEVLEAGKIRKELEKELKFCERILYGGIVSMITSVTSDIANEQRCEYILKRIDKYINKKVKPDLEEYAGFLKEAIDEHDLQRKQLKEYKETGYITSRGRTRPERLKKQDIENQEKMKKYHKAEDKTGLELPVAKGLKELEKKEKKRKDGWTVVKLKDGSEEIFKKTDASYLEKRMHNQVVSDLVKDGFFEPGDLIKGYAKCTNEDLITGTNAINYHYRKKLGTVDDCSNEENDKFFKYAQPKLFLSVDHNWKVTVMDPKTLAMVAYYDLKKDKKKK